ncbi:PREDICTED: germin-like protein 9-3 [Theobroma cacao]|uniref:Germin-like protein n=1 Tax=Theobroma cacao TaxID=3641 RepID=A0AB32UR10_THECC|nr:PREDICTED: germin-like protein 9-3 [Theobroma cacao]
MASTFFKLLSLFLLASMVSASDLDIILDFLAFANSIALDGNFFTFIGLHSIYDVDYPPNFKVTRASTVEFPALNGQSVSFASLEYLTGTLNPPHIHSRSVELLIVVDGSLEVGFVDTIGKLYTQALQVMDIFVFPKGLVHYQYNPSPDQPAMAISTFGSANAGTVSIPSTVFVTSIDDDVLAKGFKTDVATIQKIKAGLGAKAKI